MRILIKQVSLLRCLSTADPVSNRLPRARGARFFLPTKLKCLIMDSIVSELPHRVGNEIDRNNLNL